MAAGHSMHHGRSFKLPMPKGVVKNDHRDAVARARLLRAGDLVPIWVPDRVHEAHWGTEAGEGLEANETVCILRLTYISCFEPMLLLVLAVQGVYGRLQYGILIHNDIPPV